MSFKWFKSLLAMQSKQTSGFKIFKTSKLFCQRMSAFWSKDSHDSK